MATLKARQIVPRVNGYEKGWKRKGGNNVKYETSKEEKHDIGVFICVVIAWIGLEITGVF